MAEIGDRLYRHVETLFPLCRSITGEGCGRRCAMSRDSSRSKFARCPSGTPVLDLVVPREWTIRDAAITTLAGERVVDFRRNNQRSVAPVVWIPGRKSIA